MTVAQMYPVATNDPPAVWVTNYKPHPDGGFTPAKAEDRGDMSADCPYCGEALVREATERALAMMSVHCQACNRRSVGSLHPHRGKGQP